MRSLHTEPTPDSAPQPMVLEPRDSSFAAQVSRLSHVDLSSCLHCRTCAGGCPFLGAMDYAPHAVLRLIQFGMREEALDCSTIWICVGCQTCSSACPMAIDISAIMDTLRHMALVEGNEVAEPGILNFHREVLNSIQRHGRAHKLEIMLRYKVQTRDWFSDMDVGLKMLAKRKLDLRPSKIKDLGEVKRIFSPAWKG